MKYLLPLVAIASMLSSCARKDEKELYVEGKAAYDQKQYQAAIEKFQEIVDRFTYTAYAESSQYSIAIIYNNDLHDVRKALLSYQKFYTLFPSSKQAPTALFLTGFLFNNELQELDSARAAYDKFIESYSDHELASSARFELESLGKDPTQVLKSQTSSAEEPAKEKKTAPHK